jgi:hypothetical protein
MIKLILLIAICVLFTSCQCERSLEGELINQMGDAGRTNSYEYLTTFYKNLVTTTSPRAMKDSGGCFVAPLLLSSAEWVIATKNGTILLTTKTNVTWEYKLDAGEVCISSPCADEEQNLYFLTNNGKVLSLSRLGGLRWKYDFKSIDTNQTVYSELLITKTGLVIASSDGRIALVGKNGKLNWERKHTLSPTKMLSADINGNIAAILTNDEFGKTDSLVCISPDGKLKWEIGFESTRLVKYPVITKDRIYFIGLQEKSDMRVSKVFSLDLKGKIIFEKELSVQARFVSADQNGNVYITAYNSGLGESLSGIYKFDKTGKLKWKLFYEMSIPAPVMITKQELAVLGSTPKAFGVFYMQPDGNLTKTISLSDQAVFYPQPLAGPDGSINFGSTERLGMVSIAETPLDKFLPY